MVGMDGDWQFPFDFLGEIGCVPTLIGFILFVVAVTLVSRVLFN